LRLLARNKISVAASATSLEIEQLVAKNTNSENLINLREEYARVRYGKSDYSREDVARMKNYYKLIKAEIEK